MGDIKVDKWTWLYKLTWVGWLNLIILQWFFIRLGRFYERNIKKNRFKIVIGIIPGTGWNKPYRYIKHKGV
jgi:hypothetical protein